MSRFDNDLADKFEAEWPDFFRNVVCGFFLPAEWERLVWTLCGSIEHKLEWAGIPLTALRVAQVKEKFGGLRFYYDLETDDMMVRSWMNGTVALAEALSFTEGK